MKHYVEAPLKERVPDFYKRFILTTHLVEIDHHVNARKVNKLTDLPRFASIPDAARRLQLNAADLVPRKTEVQSLCACCGEVFTWSYTHKADGTPNDGKPKLYAPGHKDKASDFALYAAAQVMPMAHARGKSAEELLNEALADAQTNMTLNANRKLMAKKTFTGAYWLAHPGSTVEERQEAYEESKPFDTVDLLERTHRLLDPIHERIDRLQGQNDRQQLQIDDLRAEVDGLNYVVETQAKQLASQATEMMSQEERIIKLENELGLMRAALNDGELAKALIQLARDEAA